MYGNVIVFYWSLYPIIFFSSKITNVLPIYESNVQIRSNGMHLNHDFYVVVGNKYRTENAWAGHQHNIFI